MPCTSVSVDSRRVISMPVPLNTRRVLNNQYEQMRYIYGSSNCSCKTNNSSEEKEQSKYEESRVTKTPSRISACAHNKSEGREIKSTDRSTAGCYASSKTHNSSTQSRKTSFTALDLGEYRKTHASKNYLGGTSSTTLSRQFSARKLNAKLQALKVDRNRRKNSSDSLSSDDPEPSSSGRESSLRKTNSNPQTSDAAGLSGLLNIGNTCFLNSVVQCLSNTRLLKDFLVSKEYSNEVRTAKGALIRSFADVVRELWSGQERVINTSLFKSQIQRYAPRFMGYHQQDAQEFLRYLLEGIHDDINRVTIKPKRLPELDDDLADSTKAAESWKQYIRVDNSRIVDLFVGQLKSTLQCTNCGHKSTTFEAFWDLSLPLPSREASKLHISQCLDYFTKEEVLDGHEMPTCSMCKTRRKCTKRFSIEKFPKILVLHLKRFSPSERYRKLTAAVHFPLTELDMSSYSSSPQTSIYNLYAVSNHFGSTHSGHYTAYCFHRKTGQWYEFNDSRVAQISPKSVVSSEAYILFYEQATTPPRLPT